MQLAASIIVIRITPGSPYFSFTIYVPRPGICQSVHLVGPGICAAGAWSGLSLRTEDALDAGPDALSARARVVASNLPPRHSLFVGDRGLTHLAVAGKSSGDMGAFWCRSS